MTAGPFRYGTSFVDEASGLRLEAHHPACRPDRWGAYIDGAAREYARYGIGELLDRRALERADGISLFFVAVDDADRVVGGVRFHGPLDDVARSQALTEMARSPEVDDHRALAERATRYGVVEAKGAWRELSGNGNHSVTAALARCCVHALQWLGSEVLLAAVTERIRDVLTAVGGRMMGTRAAPYPSERYRTLLMHWPRARYGDLVDPVQERLIRQEAAQLRCQPAPSQTGWRPVLLDVTHRADRQVLANLRDDPAVEMLDVVARQRQELARLLPPPGPALLEEQPRHVYYPWRRTVVHMLGPEAFRVIRLDRNRNRITREEQDRLLRQRVGIVGLSSGHAVATTIALEGLCGELRLADFDDVELTNLNRIPASVLDVGLNKAVVAARRVTELDPYLLVQAEPEGLSADNVDDFVAGLDIVVEQCDEIDVKLLVREVARRQGVAVVMETSDRGLLDVERFDVEPDRPPFHGLLGDMTAEDMGALSTAEKIPHVLSLVEVDKASARGAASLAEIGRTLSTWPQLGSEVSLGGASVAVAVRRLGLGEPVSSGRTRVDIDAAVSSLESPSSPGANAAATAASARPGREHIDDAAAGDPVRSVVSAATLAPSCGNGQPWQFTATDGVIELELVRSKGCGAMDVRSRASYVGLGAALFNARVAAAEAGLLGPVRLFPHGPRSDVVAALSLDPGSDAELADLHPAMVERRSNRRHGTPGPLDLAVVTRLTRAAGLEGATLHLVTDEARRAACAEILAATERVRFLTPELCAETMRELRWPGDDLRTGIDVATLDLAPSELSSLRLMRRTDVMALLERWDAGQALGDYLKVAVLSSSAVAVVSMATSSPASYVAGGMALERVWIEAQRAGLAVHAIGPAFLYAVQRADFAALCGSRAEELRALSEQFRDVVNLGPSTAMALVLRLSHAPPPSARSVRLPLDAVLRQPQ